MVHNITLSCELGSTLKLALLTTYCASAGLQKLSACITLHLLLENPVQVCSAFPPVRTSHIIMYLLLDKSLFIPPCPHSRWYKWYLLNPANLISHPRFTLGRCCNSNIIYVFCNHRKVTEASNIQHHLSSWAATDNEIALTSTRFYFFKTLGL